MPKITFRVKTIALFIVIMIGIFSLRMFMLQSLIFIVKADQFSSVMNNEDMLQISPDTFNHCVGSEKHVLSDTDLVEKIVPSNRNIKIVFVICGEKDALYHQLLNALKSVTLFSLSQSQVIIITDSDEQKNFLLSQISKWPNKAQRQIQIYFHDVWYPKGYEWMKKYRTLCTTEKLYIPDILPEEDAIIYLDTDIIMFDYVDKLWDVFSQMNNTQCVAMAPEHEDPANAYYNSHYNKIPYYGPLGLNAGVILMNLTRMRNVAGGWINLVHRIYHEYKYSPLHFADQDILNIIFSKFPELFLPLPCNWNYRSDHCSVKGNTCSSANEKISLLHGNRNVFQNMKDLTFRSIYKAFQNYNWEQDLKTHLLQPLKTGLEKEYNTFCGNNVSIFISSLDFFMAE